MSFWQFLKHWRTGLQQKNKTYHFVLGTRFPFELKKPDTQEDLDRSDVDSLAVSSSHDLQQDTLYRLWTLLSPREQDVTALTCLRYTNPQIAARLGLSKETVKTYLQKVLNKLGLQGKADLRVMFAGWDFSDWERRRTHR